MPDAIEWYLFELNEHLEGRVPDERRDHILQEARAHLESKSDDLAALIGNEAEARKRAVTQYGSPKVHAQMHLSELSRASERVQLILTSALLGAVPVSPEIFLKLTGTLLAVPFLLQLAAVFVAMLWKPKRTFLAPAFAALYVIGIQISSPSGFGGGGLFSWMTLLVIMLLLQMSAGYIHHLIKRRKLAESATSISPKLL